MSQEIELDRLTASQSSETCDTKVLVGWKWEKDQTYLQEQMKHEPADWCGVQVRVFPHFRQIQD